MDSLVGIYFMSSPIGSSDNEDGYDGVDCDGDDYDGDSIAIIQFQSGDDFEADLVILVNDAQILVTGFAPCQSSTSSIEKHNADLTRQASFDGGDGYNSHPNTTLDIIQPAREEEFRRVAPKAPASSSRRTDTRLTILGRRNSTNDCRWDGIFSCRCIR